MPVMPGAGLVEMALAAAEKTREEARQKTKNARLETSSARLDRGVPAGQPASSTLLCQGRLLQAAAEFFRDLPGCGANCLPVTYSIHVIYSNHAPILVHTAQ